ncbi:MAG TPA: hypothetical protein VGG33_05245 [Polyangia bacterium]
MKTALTLAIAALGACSSSEGLSPEAQAVGGAFVSVSVGSGGFCQKRLEPCATVTVVKPSPPQIVHGLYGREGVAKPLSELELSRVTAVVDSLAFRRLMAGMREQCHHIPDSGISLAFVTDRWMGRDDTAAGCIVGEDTGSHPYRSLYRVVTELQVRHFGEPPPAEGISACLINQGDGEICETYVPSECAVVGGVVRHDLKCIDGRRFPDGDGGPPG